MSKQPRPARSIAWRTLLRGLRMDARAQMAVVQLAAIGASLGLLVLEGTVQGPGTIGFSIVIVVGFGVLRVLTAGVSLAMSTLVFEPIGNVVLLAGTGGPTSPFLPMALSGIWWAALSPRGARIRPFRIVRGSRGLRVEPGEEVEVGAKRPTWLVYGVSLAASYALLVALPAVRDGLITEAFEDAIVLGGVWLLAELSDLAARRRVANAAPSALVPPAEGRPMGPRSRRPLAESAPSVIAGVPPGPAAMEAFNPAVQATTVDYVASVELAPTTEQVELSPIESHLLACLALGLSNRQIADALHVSQGTVRYRLTRLYRSLDVHGRDEAVSRARELGMAPSIDLRRIGP